MCNIFNRFITLFLGELRAVIRWPAVSYLVYIYIYIYSSALPPLSSPVLEPSLDLCVRHLELLGQRSPLAAGQVFLFVEPLLQLVNLIYGRTKTVSHLDTSQYIIIRILLIHILRSR